MNFEISFGDVIQIVATCIVAFEIFRVARESKNQRVQTSKLETLNFLEAYNEDVKGFVKWVRSSGSKEELLTPSGIDPEARDIIARYLTACERLAVGVRHGVYSFDIVNQSISKSLRRNFVRLRPYIDLRRSEAKTDRVYEQFEWLCFILEAKNPDKRLPSDWKMTDAATMSVSTSN